MDMRLIPVNNATLNVKIQGSGPAVMLVHGFPFDHRMWLSLSDHLSTKYRVITPDLRGFGMSTTTEGVVTMQQMADDLYAVLHALDIREPIVLCGLSMGGYVALQFVKKYADRLRGLILCDTRTGADPPEVKKNRNLLADSITEEARVALAEGMIPKLFSRRSLDENASSIDFVRRMVMQQSPTGIAAASRGMALREDTTDLLPSLACPSLVIVGAEDVPSPPDEMRSMADKLPGAQFIQLEDAGHMTPLEKPDVFNSAVETFLGMITT
jgi:3-oxoadipate enol-lactonase